MNLARQFGILVTLAPLLVISACAGGSGSSASLIGSGAVVPPPAAPGGVAVVPPPPPPRPILSSSGIGQEQGFDKASPASAPVFGAAQSSIRGLNVQSDKYVLSGAFDGAVVTPSLSFGNPRFLVDDGSPDGFAVRRGTATTATDVQSLAFYDDARAGVTDEIGVVSFQSFGYWTFNWNDPKSSARQGIYGSFSVGAQTAGSAIPTSGTSKFVGHLLGTYVSGDSLTTREVAAPMSLDVDFARRSASFNSPNWRDAGTVYAGTALSGVLAYQAQTNALAGTLTTANGEMSGPASGQFYGPVAQEVGGVFTLLPAKGGADRMYGGFGAARQ